MNGLNLSERMSLGNGYKLLRRGNRHLIYGFEVSFDETCAADAQAAVNVEKTTTGDIRCTTYVSVSGNNFAASIRNMPRGDVGVAYIQVVRSWSGTDMEVIMGDEIQPIMKGSKLLARIKVKDASTGGVGGVNLDPDSQSSEDEPEPINKNFQIFDKFFDGQSSAYTVNSETTVKELKYMIKDRRGYPPDQQILQYKKQLQDGRTLGSYGIEAGATVNMTTRLRGG